MNTKLLVIIAIASFLCVSCKKTGKKVDKKVEKKETKSVASEKTEATKKDWAYSGETSPENWKDLAGDAACGGHSQSPINIISADVIDGSSGLKLSDIHYQQNTTIEHVINNGHTIEYVFEDGDNYVDYKGKRYDLAQFHFHSLSEHAVDGLHYPLVKHMVHTSKDGGYLVLAVFFEEGEKSTAFDFLESYLPIKQGEKKAVDKKYNFTTDIPSTFDHFNYTGSLTTPPCTEGVNWIIFTQAEIISEAQAKVLSDLMPINNFRPTQSLNDRKVILSK